MLVKVAVDRLRQNETRELGFRPTDTESLLQLSHGSPILIFYCAIFIFPWAKNAKGEFETRLDPVPPRCSLMLITKRIGLEDLVRGEVLFMLEHKGVTVQRSDRLLQV